MVLILFDIDGTILSTNGAGRRAVTSAISSVLGRNVDIADVSFSGRTDLAIMADILDISGTDVSDDMLDACISAYRNALESTLRAEDIVVYPGVRKLISRLAARSGVHLGLVTGNLEQTAYCKLRLAGLDAHFRVGAFGSDHADRNRLPELAARRAAQAFGRPFRADRTLVIGDTVHDIACSRYFGARSVAVCTGLTDRETLDRAAPDLLIESMHPGTEIDRLVESLLETGSPAA
ncbi:MAG: HAD hydrolase-like protein [Rhodothermales bacterium]|nr:HAD hydrolase-like protein [Rhodothermales bacterium]